MKLFIGSLPSTITESDLSSLCTPFGELVNVKLATDYVTGEPKGFGFIEMSTRSAGHKVMEELNGMEYKHRILICNEARPPKKKSRGRR